MIAMDSCEHERRCGTCRMLCRIRDQVDKMLASDRALSLLVAMESALDDNRYEVQHKTP